MYGQAVCEGCKRKELGMREKWALGGTWGECCIRRGVVVCTCRLKVTLSMTMG